MGIESIFPFAYTVTDVNLRKGVAGAVSREIQYTVMALG